MLVVRHQPTLKLCLESAVAGRATNDLNACTCNGLAVRNDGQDLQNMVAECSLIHQRIGTTPVKSTFDPPSAALS